MWWCTLQVVRAFWLPPGLTKAHQSHIQKPPRIGWRAGSVLKCWLLFWRTESGSLNPLPVVYDGLISESRGSGSLTHLHKHPHTLGRHTDIHRNKKLKIGLSKESLNVWIIFHVELDERTKQQAKTHSSSNTAFILTHITSVFIQKWILDEYPRLAWYWLKSYCSMFDTYKCWFYRCFHRYIWPCLQVSGQSR